MELSIEGGKGGGGGGRRRTFGVEDEVRDEDVQSRGEVVPACAGAEKSDSLEVGKDLGTRITHEDERDPQPLPYNAHDYVEIHERVPAASFPQRTLFKA